MRRDIVRDDKDEREQCCNHITTGSSDNFTPFFLNKFFFNKGLKSRKLTKLERPLLDWREHGNKRTLQLQTIHFTFETLETK